MSFVYSKKVRAKAIERSKDLFACGFARASGGGKNEFVGPMAIETAEALFYFALKVQKGETPADAFASTDWPRVTDGKDQPIK